MIRFLFVTAVCGAVWFHGYHLGARRPEPVCADLVVETCECQLLWTADVELTTRPMAMTPEAHCVVIGAPR